MTGVEFGPKSPATPPAADGETRRRMERQGHRDTDPELALRRALWACGVRGYRLEWRLPFDRRRRADIAWPGLGVAVFIDGCFWHRCPDHFTLPKHNREWWREKIATSVRRDRDTDERPEASGWVGLRLLEHRFSDDLDPCAELVARTTEWAREQ